MPFVLVFLMSLLIVAFTIPSIISVSSRKGLFDDPNEKRKIHQRTISSFGGIAIFTGFIFTCSLFIPFKILPQSNVLMAGGLILFMIGIRDDLIGLSLLTKFTAQFTSAFIVAIIADLRIADLHGVIGIYDIPYYASLLLTAFFIVGIVNAFNLIDGIDGLAGTLGVILSLVYTFLFYKAGNLGWSYLSIGLCGSLIGFLFFNVTPAKIFMGDSGSLLLGFMASILSIKFMDVSSGIIVMAGPIAITSGVALAASILIVPIFDTLRVFTLRISRNTSPFIADSSHIHHRLLFLGLSHVQATLVLAVVNVLFIIMALSLQYLGNATLVCILMLGMLSLNGVLTLCINRHKKTLLQSVEVVPSGSNKSYGEKILEEISEN